MGGRLFITIAFILIAIFVNAQVDNRYDGPYIYYQHGKGIILNLHGTNEVIRDTFPESERKTKRVFVQFSQRGDWDFSVVLKPDIKPEPCNWESADSVIVFSDIEGEFEAFRGLLIANRVMDSTYAWTFGKGHLVICGDLFDRGIEVTAVLWLLYKLEEESVESGGYVHTILGNHDIMNLSGDFRYVDKKYFNNVKVMGRGYADLYNKKTELGRWLRSKNIIEKVSDHLYLHGGISPEILAKKMSVSNINDACRPFLDKGLNPEAFPDKNNWDFFDDDNISPFWYRGYFTKPNAGQGLIDSTLVFYDVKKIIVGHDIIKNVACYYQGKVIGIDVNEHEGNYQGLLLENKKAYKIDMTGQKQALLCE